MLEINNLHVSIGETKILKGVNLRVNAGEVHAIMGPNGSGKSTFFNVLTGREEYDIISGSVTFDGKNLSEMEIENRAHAGLFMAFQYPVEIPGVTNATFLKSAINANRIANGEKELNPVEIIKLLKSKTAQLGIDNNFLKRSLNAGFSGGEKKRNEMLQMALLNPKLALLDETDSGLDIDALKVVAEAVNRRRNDQHSFIIVTHYQRLLDYIIPDFVHIMHNGQIVETGNKDLAHKLEKEGYDWITNVENPI